MRRPEAKYETSDPLDKLQGISEMVMLPKPQRTAARHFHNNIKILNGRFNSSPPFF
jgi:hypothetical protein